MNAKEKIFSRGISQTSRISGAIALVIAVQLTFGATSLRANFFMNTGSMTTPRYYHAASLLGNGKVLVSGGYSGSSILATATLYDPASGTWSAAGSMPVGRYLHTSTLLANGKVLVVGGWTNTTGALASAALYDPTTGTWSATGPLITARYYHTATLLNNGKVLVTGGYNTNYLSSAELYDPATGTWSATTSMSQTRYLHTATVLQSGTVLVTGGISSTGTLATAALYDPLAGTWSSAGSMPAGRYYHTATRLPNSKVLVAGGFGGLGALSSAALYDPGTGTWSATGSLITGRYVHGAALLPDGKVLVSGGYGSSYLSSAEIYNPATGTWSSTGAMNTARYAETATALSDGRVLVAGGTGSSGALASAELFIPTVSSWAATGSLNIEHEFHDATLLPSGKVLVAGGWINTTVTDICELYEPRTATWTTTGSLPVPRYLHTLTLLTNGKVLAVGGYSTSLLLSNTALYNPAAGTWSSSGSLPHGRYYHTATQLRNGKVLVTGGTTNGSVALATAYLYDPAAGTWTATMSMASNRMLHTATLLPNGKVLVAGGNGASAELYDPTAGTWSSTGSMPAARSYHTAAVLTNGKVLVAGGYGSGVLSSAALYDPDLGTWSATGSMYTQRYYHQMVTLPDGKVMVVGGLMPTGYNTPGCEVYDTATGTWSPTGSLNKGRYDHTATALANGKVLVAGGGNFSYEPMNNAELYAPLLVDPKSSGGFAYSTVVYASTGSQYIARYQTPTNGYAINRRVDISPFYDFIDPTWGFDGSSVPINGILKVPTGTGPFPLALFVHGNHEAFDYSDEGYIYLCEVLASWGILAGTIDANFLNEGGGENGARGILHLEHVRQFEIWHTNVGHALYGKVDFNHIMIVGHSRGGEGVGHASYYNTYAGNNPVTLDGSAGLGPYGFNLTAVVAIAPTDGQYSPAEGVQPVRDNYFVVHGSRDNDVWTFEGQMTYDRAHPIDVTPPIDNAEGYKALLWAFGANHNHFNSTWDNEWGAVPTLTRAEQENVAKVYIGGIAQATLLNRPGYLDLLKNYEVGKSWWPASALLISQYQEAIRHFIDHYEEDSNTSTLSPPSSGANTWSAASFTETFFNNGWDIIQETYGVNLTWSASTHFYQAAFTSPGLNLGGYPYLALRIGQLTGSENPVGADQNLKIIIQDTSGGTAFYTATAFPRLLYPDDDTWNIKLVMQTIRIPMSLIRDRVNVKNIASVKLLFDQVSTGNVYFDDLQISN